MTRIGKAYGYTVKNVIIHTVFAPQKLRTAFLSVLYGVERNISRFARAFCPSVAPLSLKLLYVRRILKHNFAELRCGRGCVNRPFVSVCRKVRQLAGMVYVSMGQKNAVYIGGRYGNVPVFICVGSLLHTAVNQNVLAAGGEKRAASRDFVCGS